MLAAPLLAASLATVQPMPVLSREEIIFQTLNAVDAVQTIYCLRKVRGCVEVNPIVGKNPGTGTIIAYKLANGVLHYAVTRHLQRHHPEWVKTWQVISIGVQGGVVAANFRVVF